MQKVSDTDFLSWAATHGIVPDTRYHEPRSLVYVPEGPTRFWEFPDLPAAWPAFVDRVLTGMEPWSACYVWPRGGRWPRAVALKGPDDAVREAVLRAAGIPLDFTGAARFEAGERDLVLTLLFVYMAFGGCVLDDLFVVPDHGRQFLMTSHHEVIHVHTADGCPIEGLIGHMAGAGFRLPTELPDETFKRPKWMGEAKA